MAPARPQSPHDESQIADRLSRPLDRGAEQRRRSERPRPGRHQFHLIGTQVETVSRGQPTLQIARRASDREESRSPARTGTTAWVAGSEWKRKEHASEADSRDTDAGRRHHHPRGQAKRSHIRAAPRITGPILFAPSSPRPARRRGRLSRPLGASRLLGETVSLPAGAVVSPGLPPLPRRTGAPPHRTANATTSRPLDPRRADERLGHSYA